MTASAAAVADALLDTLPRVVLVVGKGGVGKTTSAAALALRAADAGATTLLLTTDPARALPDVVAEPVGSSATVLAASPRLQARVLDAAALRAAFLERWGDVLRLILDRGTYLDDADIAPLVDAALPGGDEIFAALELARILTGTDAPWHRIVVDTAPTGHTLRLLELPRTFRALVQLLDAMQGKHRFMVRALTRAYRRDSADQFLTEMDALVSALDGALRDKSALAAVLVTNDQPLVLDESSRYLASLSGLGIRVAAILWNAATRTPTLVPEVPAFAVPRLSAPPVGAAGLRAWAAALRAADDVSATVEAPSEEPTAGPETSADLRPLVRRLTIVAGKGGVGKTSVACALALAGRGNQRTLLVSTDPAPSVADALALPIPDADTPVPGADGLFARQMDATAAFARARDEYSNRVDALFDSIVGRGMDLAADRAILRDLLALAPPGIDEVYALSLISDALVERTYGLVIVDPAPTGHLLRLLEMPTLALTWAHQLMRLMLKYKDVAGLGDAAGEVLGFSKRLRALDALLRDPEQCGVVVVALDEPIVLAESERLAATVRAHGVAITGVVLNRATDRTGALPVRDAPLHFEAPLTTPAPIGVPGLERWADTWRRR